jgi:hypothetical protein
VSLFGTGELCGRDGCGHAMSKHVSDSIMHEGEWIAVHRCIVCEHEGGPCLDSASVLASGGADG